MVRERKIIARIFVLLTIAYMLYSILLWPSGYYYVIICQKYLRELFSDGLDAVVMITVICSIIYLHMQTYEQE